MNPGGPSRPGGGRSGRSDYCACPDCIRARRAEKARRREENQEYLSQMKAERWEFKSTIASLDAVV